MPHARVEINPNFFQIKGNRRCKNLFHTIAHRIALITSLAVLNNCGTLYISPTVPLNDPNVQIVEVTQGVVKIANGSAYSPRALPRPRSADITAIDLQSAQPVVPRIASRQQTISATPVLRLPPQTKTKRYQIGVSDVVSLTGRSKPIPISGAEDQRRSNIYTVQDSGAIALPDVGSIKVAGLTIQDAHSAVFKRRAANQITDAFALDISEFNSQQIIVGGAVKTHPRIPVTFAPSILSDAIAAAGGIVTKDERSTSIKIYRLGELYQLPLTDYLQTSDLQRLPLMSGDAVYVHVGYDLATAQAYFSEQIARTELSIALKNQRTEQITAQLSALDLQQRTEQAAIQMRIATDSMQRDYVYLTGEASKQTRFPLPFEHHASLADALFHSGGLPTTTANISQTYILRKRSSVSPIAAYKFDFSNAANLVIATEFQLRPNDVIFAAEQPITKWHRVIQQIAPSLITTGVVATN